MRLCLISTEVFAFGRYGGFGRATRTIGRALTHHEVDVHVMVPRRPGQQALEHLVGMQVHGISPWNLPKTITMLRRIDADVYHSQEPTVATWCAQRAVKVVSNTGHCRVYAVGGTVVWDMPEKERQEYIKAYGQ